MFIKNGLCNINIGDRGCTVVKMLCYKSEGRWFDPEGKDCNNIMDYGEAHTGCLALAPYFKHMAPQTKTSCTMDPCQFCSLPFAAATKVDLSRLLRLFTKSELGTTTERRGGTKEWETTCVYLERYHHQEMHTLDQTRCAGML